MFYWGLYQRITVFSDLSLFHHVGAIQTQTGSNTCQVTCDRVHITKLHLTKKEKGGEKVQCRLEVETAAEA